MLQRRERIEDKRQRTKEVAIVTIGAMVTIVGSVVISNSAEQKRDPRKRNPDLR